MSAGPLHDSAGPMPAPMVSTGDLPDETQIARILSRGVRALPRRRATARSPTTSRRWPRRRPTCSASASSARDGQRARGRRRRRTASRSRACPSRSCSPWCARPSATTRRRRPARGEQHRPAVQLGDGHRAQRRPDDEPDGQRRRDRDHQPRARARPPTRSGSSSRDGPVALRRPRRSSSTRRSTRPSRRPTCATRASPTCSTATAGCTSIPTRPPTSTPGSARCW